MTLFKAFRPELVIGTLYAHNIFLELLAEIGIVGLLSFVVLLFSFYKKFIENILKGKDKSFYIYIAISVTSFIAINLVDYNFFVPANMIMFFIVFSSMFYVESEERQKIKINFYACLAAYVVFVILFARPVIANNYYKKGINFYVSGHYKVAIEEFNKAINFDKNNPEYYAQVSRAYFALYDKERNEKGQIYADKAIEYLQHAIKLNKYAAQLKASLAAVYWNNGKKEEALETIQEAMKYDKHDPDYEAYYYQLKNS
jgi:tetratricopeptide (TPR) repeat protein